MRRIPSSQTTLDLDDLKEGVVYVVRVSALAGSQEGSAASLSIRLGMGAKCQEAQAGLSVPIVCKQWGSPPKLPRTRPGVEEGSVVSLSLPGTCHFPGTVQ